MKAFMGMGGVGMVSFQHINVMPHFYNYSEQCKFLLRDALHVEKLIFSRWILWKIKKIERKIFSPN